MRFQTYHALWTNARAVRGARGHLESIPRLHGDDPFPFLEGKGDAARRDDEDLPVWMVVYTIDRVRVIRPAFRAEAFTS